MSAGMKEYFLSFKLHRGALNIVADGESREAHHMRRAGRYFLITVCS